MENYKSLTAYLRDGVTIASKTYENYDNGDYEVIVLTDRYGKRLAVTHEEGSFVFSDKVPDNFDEPEEEKLLLENLDYVGSSKDHSLRETLTILEICKALPGVAKKGGDGDGKVRHEWCFAYKGEKCAIWDYKGARWSAYGPEWCFKELGLM